MASKPSRSRDDAEAPGLLAAVLAPHLDELGEAARARAERAAAAEVERAHALALAARPRLDEAELMALIFTKLDPENPRVCAGIEFDRLIILSAPARVPREPSSARTSAPAPAPRSDLPADAERSSVDPAASDRPAEAPPPDASDWVGRSWIDDIRPIPAAVLDRPELDAEQRALLARASRRELDGLNLRHLDRVTALAHFELFVRACRARRRRYCRVIPGKGVDSRAEPVLKRAVLERCREPDSGVRGWAPELDRHGEWGAVILELELG